MIGYPSGYGGRDDGVSWNCRNFGMSVFRVVILSLVGSFGLNRGLPPRISKHRTNISCDDHPSECE
jgi:hypothetical protein